MPGPKPNDESVMGLTARQVAHLLGHSESWFSPKRRYEKLYPAGFPRPNPVTGRWNSDAVVAWDRRMAGLDDPPPGTLASGKPASLEDVEWGKSP